MAETLTVRSAFRDYSVQVGGSATDVLRERLAAEKTFVVCDARVHELWRDDLAPLLQPGRHALLAPTEESKTIQRVTALLEELVAAGVRRDHTIVAIGGGITQDVTAFAASILYRGIEWVFVPTTLLAQADSCIGSKTSINLGDRKNLVGNFWPPAFAVIDPRFLTTLPADDIGSGIGEMLHFYLYADSALTRPMLAERDRLLRERERIVPYVVESLRIKQRVVELDEFDRGERHKFNYGHTFGHALESVTGFEIPHGLAVTVGMDLANYVSVSRGLMPRPVFDDTHALLAANMPARNGRSIDLDRYVEFLRRDKKNLGASVGCILAERPGCLRAEQVPVDDAFRSTLREYFTGAWWA